MEKLTSSLRLLGAAALISMASVACATAQDAGAPAPAAPAVDAAKTTRLAVKVGDTATMALRSNATTGYSWELSAPLPEDSPVGVEFEIISSKANVGGMPVCGAPGETHITFTGIHAGMATVKLVYIRPWEKGKEPADSRTVIVTVSK